MLSKKLALFSAVPLFCAGLAMAQTADPKGPPTQEPRTYDLRHHPDHAAMHKEMCEDALAHTAAKLAYVEARIGLTDAQKPLFAKWRQAVLDGAGKRKAACLAEAPPKTPPAAPTVIEREAHEEAALQARLQLLQSTRPALQAFYDSLSEAQKESFNHMHEQAMRAHGGFGHGGETPFTRHPQ